MASEVTTCQKQVQKLFLQDFGQSYVFMRFNLEKETSEKKENYQQYINKTLIFLLLNRKQFITHVQPE